jgi:predicted lipid-binding transport protein (Tim44 family)
MATPLRKDEPQFEDRFEDQGITTADLAQGKRPASEARGPQPVTSDRAVERVAGASEVAATDALATSETTHEGGEPLFPREELQGLRTRWKDIQVAFVDEPRKAVEQADGLVASAMKRLAEVFAEERSGLEKQWDRGDSVSTEDLRVALQRYRTFFDRLLSV